MAPVSAHRRPQPDEVLREIADYVVGHDLPGEKAYDTARYCLMDSIGCGLLALGYPECAKLLGPVVRGADLQGGARVPGTQFELDPVTAAFNIGTAIRWLDYNDTWLAAEWGHPSDNLGAILATADYLSRLGRAEGKRPLVVRDILTAMIKAHEVQGILALENSFNRRGLDHTLLVRVASSAVVSALLGGSKEDVMNAVSNAFADGSSLRVYRQEPNTGSRKSWAAGDATSRGVYLALMAIGGEMGYPSALTAPMWGFQDALFGGVPLVLARPLGSYVMENVLFKVSFPAEFHAQTAVEAAFTLHPKVHDRLEEIEKVIIITQEPAVRIISKTGPLHNPADRDHCLQYMVAIGLIFGSLTAEHYEDAIASDPRIDMLRSKIAVEENKRYTKDYYDPDKHSIANALQVYFMDQTSTEKVAVEYPLGHPRRRAEGIPLLESKFEANLKSRFPAQLSARIIALCLDADRLNNTPVDEFMGLLVI